MMKPGSRRDSMRGKLANSRSLNDWLFDKGLKQRGKKLVARIGAFNEAGELLAKHSEARVLSRYYSANDGYTVRKIEVEL